MKITLNRQSEVFLVHKLANQLERNTNLKVYMEYYWKGDNGLRNARFDLVLFDNELNIKAIIEAKHKKRLEVGAIIIEPNSMKFIKTKQLERYYEILSKHNIPLILANLDENNESKVLNDILEILYGKY